MKWRRLLPVTLALSLFGSATVCASSLWGSYEGFSKIKLLINGKEQSFHEKEVPPLIINGSAMLPAKTINTALRGWVKWDSNNMTLSVYRPNVHMFLARDVSSDYSIKQTFGKVKKGEKLSFVVFAQVDGLKTDIDSFRISIESPSGKQVVEPHVHRLPEQKESFWYPWPFTVSFDEAGTYTVKFAMKPDANSDYIVVSEKSIVSVSE